MLVLAVLPGAVLFWTVWSSDQVEREPMGLLIKLLLWGGATTVSATVLGLLFGIPAGAILNKNGLLYLLIDNFLLTALIEEGGKYIVMKRLTWTNPAFNYSFDAVVYAVCASLGFATVENILYLLDGSLGTAIARAIFSVPGHAIDAVFMGSYYALAKKAQVKGESSAVKANLRKALLVPTLLHGFYDFSLENGSDGLILAFLVFEVVVTVIAVKRVRTLAKNDTALVD
jgi:RsiW-degrading membrane proteinase PrsW (M82 family)